MPDDNFGFLVIGAGRGGTSVLAASLDAHDALEVGFEQFSEGYLMGKALATAARGMFDQRALAFVRACRDEAARFPAVSWGNKITTEQVFGLEDHNVANPDAPVAVLDRFFNHHLRGVKIVFVLRDGRTCVRSKVARTGQSLELACERWKYSVKVYRFLESRHDNRICVRFEDLLRDPERTLTAICTFLGVAYQPAMLAGTRSEKMRPDYRQPQLDTSKLALFDVPPGCLERIGDDLRLCGYL